jgi:hypothetical protein
VLPEAIESLGIGAPLTAKVGASIAELERGRQFVSAYPPVRGGEAARNLLVSGFALIASEEDFVQRNLSATNESNPFKSTGFFNPGR